MAIKHVAGTRMKIELLGENIFVAEIVAEAGQRRRIVEGQGAQAAVLGKIDRQMAGYAGAAAIADEHDLVAGVMRLASRALAPSRNPASSDKLFDVTVANFGFTDQIGQSIEVLLQLVAHAVHLRYYFSRPMMPLIRADLLDRAAGGRRSRPSARRPRCR